MGKPTVSHPAMPRLTQEIAAHGALRQRAITMLEETARKGNARAQHLRTKLATLRPDLTDWLEKGMPPDDRMEKRARRYLKLVDLVHDAEHGGIRATQALENVLPEHRKPVQKGLGRRVGVLVKGAKTTPQQPDLFSQGQSKAPVTGGTTRVKGHTAKNPGGQGTHWVQGHPRVVMHRASRTFGVEHEGHVHPKTSFTSLERPLPYTSDWEPVQEADIKAYRDVVEREAKNPKRSIGVHVARGWDLLHLLRDPEKHIAEAHESVRREKEANRLARKAAKREAGAAAAGFGVKPSDLKAFMVLEDVHGEVHILEPTSGPPSETNPTGLQVSHADGSTEGIGREGLPTMSALHGNDAWPHLEQYIRDLEASQREQQEELADPAENWPRVDPSLAHQWAAEILARLARRLADARAALDTLQKGSLKKSWGHGHARNGAAGKIVVVRGRTPPRGS